MALFELDFDLRPAPAKPIAAPVAESAQDAARHEHALDQAWNDGYAAGSRQALDLMTVQLAPQGVDHAASIGQVLHLLADAQAKAVAEAAETVSQQIFITLVNLFPMLMRQNGPGEITALVGELLVRLSRPATIVVKLAPDMARQIGPALEQALGDHDHRITITPAPSIAVGDAEIIWERGALHRKTGPVLAALSQMLRQLGLSLEAPPMQPPIRTQAITAKDHVNAV